MGASHNCNRATSIDSSLAICSAETGSVVVSTCKASSREPDTGTGMGGVRRVAAEHAHTRSKFGTAKGDHMFTREISITILAPELGQKARTGYVMQRYRGDLDSHG